MMQNNGHVFPGICVCIHIYLFYYYYFLNVEKEAGKSGAGLVLWERVFTVVPNRTFCNDRNALHTI